MPRPPAEEVDWEVRLAEVERPKSVTWSGLGLGLGISGLGSGLGLGLGVKGLELGLEG